MSLSWIDDRVPTGLGGRFYGVYPAVVTDVMDPDGQGRARVRLPWAMDPSGPPLEAWARLATLMAGSGRGSFFVPDPGDEVLVAFGGGDPGQPFIVGSLWNGKDKPPVRMEKGNPKRVLRSRRGVTVAIQDKEGHESFVVETPGGQRLTLQDGPAGVTIEDANQNRIQLGSAGVSVMSAGTIALQGAAVKITGATVTVNAGASNFSGVVTCPTLTATTVVGSTYTPGAGNIW